MKLYGFLFLILGCALSSCMTSQNILVTIGDLDTITVQQYKSLVSQTKIKAESIDEKKLLLLPLITERLMVRDAKDKHLDQLPDFLKSMEKAENDFLLNEAYKRYIYGHFINDTTIRFYKNNFNRSAEVKRIFYRYKDNPRAKTKRTREMAVHFIDSLMTVLNPDNFDTIAYRYSEYIDGKTRKGKIHSEWLKFGNLPFEYENNIFHSLPGQILKPIELPGSLMIPYVSGFKSDSGSIAPSDYDIRMFLKNKFDLSDYHLIVNYSNYLTDSLFNVYECHNNESAIDTFVNRYCRKLTVGTIKTMMDSATRRMPMVSMKGGKFLTMYQFIDNYDSSIWIGELKRPIIIKIIEEQMREKILMIKLIDDHIKETDHYIQHMQAQYNRLILESLKKIELAIPETVPTEDLRRYYEDHKEVYKSKPAVTVDQISASAEKNLYYALPLIKRGFPFQRVVDSVNTLIKRLTQTQTASLTFTSQIDITDSAEILLLKNTFTVDSGSVSPIMKSEDGSCRIIKVTGKKDPIPQNFFLVQKEVKESYLQEWRKIQEQQWMNRLKKKRPVIIYEKNL
jgi:hypothetical protein